MTDQAVPGEGLAEGRIPLASLDALDEAYIRGQDIVAERLADGDVGGAERAGRDASGLRTRDASGRLWRILGPLPTATPQPHFRYRYRYQRSDDGERFWNSDRFRFARHPSLAAESADAITGRWLRVAIRAIEPAAYVAIVMVGIGLWFLLGDLIGTLPGIVVLGMMVLAAAGLWWISVSMRSVPYQEAARLAQLTRLAAIGVTGAVAWVSTVEAESVTTATRLLITSAVVLLAAVGSFAMDRGADTWAVATGAWCVAAVAGAVVIAEAAYASPDADASAQLGALVAAAVAFPLATRSAALRWVPFGIPFVAIVAAWALAAATVDSPRDLHTVLMVAGGVVVTAAAWTSGRLLDRPFRSVHRVAAYALGALTVLVALTQGPWDALFDWLADVPLPVVLVMVGSALLIAVGLVVRTAVNRLSDDSR